MSTRIISLSKVATVAFAALFALNSCQLEPYEIPITELYTRSFIKEFGLIDPNQDWNMAREANVTIDVGEHANTVRVYCKLGEQYYLVADLIDINGTVTVPVDIPESATDLKVTIDGHAYYTSPGGTVSVSATAPASRGISTSISGVNFPSGNFTIAVSEGGYVNYNAQQISPIVYNGSKWNDYYTLNTSAGTSHWRYNTKGVGGLLPEIDKGNDGTSVGNINAYDHYHEEYINKDFYLDLGENGKFTIQPVYWQTSGTHTLCIYPVDNDGNPLDKDGNSLTLPEISTVLSGKTYDSSLTWDYIVTHSYNEIIAKLGDNSDGQFAALQNAVKTNITDKMVILPFYKDKEDDDIQKGAAASGGSGSGSDSGSDSDSGSGSDSGTHTLTLIKYATDEDDLKPLYHAMFTYNSSTNSYDYDDTKFPAFKTSVLNLYASYIANCSTCGENVTWTATNVELGDSFNYYYGPLTITLEHTVSLSRTASRDEDPMPDALVADGATWTSTGWASPTFTMDELSTPTLARSKTFTVEVKQNSSTFAGKVGMCIYYSTYSATIFSQSILNLGVYGTNKPCPNAATTCYAASYVHPMSDRIYFSFEDWIGESSDMDLNDLVYLLTDVESVEGTSTINTKSSSSATPTLSWVIAAEDLGSTDDFDFNDVVFSLQSITTNHTEYVDTNGNGVQDEGEATTKTTMHKQVKVRALAAGGTLPVWLHYNDGATDYVLGPDGAVATSSLSTTDAAAPYEWHRWFGYSSNKIINTDYGTSLGAKVDDPSSIVLATQTLVNEVESSSSGISAILTGDFKIEDYSQTYQVDGSIKSIKGFYITVETYNAVSKMTDVDMANTPAIGASGVGSAPQMFLIPDIGADSNGWRWPIERGHIMTAYPTFKDWVSNSTIQWYKTPVNGTTTRPVK